MFIEMPASARHISTTKVLDGESLTLAGSCSSPVKLRIGLNLTIKEKIYLKCSVPVVKSRKILFSDNRLLVNCPIGNPLDAGRHTILTKVQITPSGAKDRETFQVHFNNTNRKGYHDKMLSNEKILKFFR